MYNEIAIAAQTVDSHFSYMGLEESAADLLRHLLWEIEEYREADAGGPRKGGNRHRHSRIAPRRGDRTG